jgi:hypothetical protein
LTNARHSTAERTTRGVLTTVVAAAAIALIGAAPVCAQGLMSPEGTYFISLSAGVQPQERSFGTTSTFTSFNETGTTETAQNIARATFIDLTGGYQFTRRLALGLGIWGSRADSAVAATAVLPDAVLFNRFQTVNFTADDLSQLVTGFNVQLMFRQPLGDRLDVTLSLGPTLLYVRQQVGVVTVTPNTLNAVLEPITQSKATMKAGHAGLEVGFRLRDGFGLGVFARYAGGEVDLPSAPKLRVGGTQIGGGLRFRF